MGIRIDALPATTIPTIEHILAAIKDGQTVKLTVAQILSLQTAGDLAYTASGPSGLGSYPDVKLALDALGDRASLWLPTTQSIATGAIPASRSTLVTTGYEAIGDGGGATFARILAPPAHPGYVVSADGAIWENVTSTVTPDMFGPRSAVQSWVAAAATGRPVLATGAAYDVTATTLDDNIALMGVLSRLTIEGEGVTLRLAAGVTNMPGTTTIAVVNGRKLKVLGADTVSLTSPSLVSIVSIAARQHDVTFSFANASILSVGDYIGICATTGTLSKILEGAWKVTVIAGSNVTVRNTARVSDINAAAEPTTLTAGTFFKFATVLKYSGGGWVVKADMGADSAQTSFFDQMILVGPGRSVGSHYGVLIEYGCTLSTKTKFAVTEFSRYCYYLIYGAVLNAYGSIASNCGQSGFYALDGGVLQAVNGISAGNEDHGFVASVESVMAATGCAACGNNIGILLSGTSQGTFSNAYADYNASFGLSGETNCGGNNLGLRARRNGLYGVRAESGTILDVTGASDIRNNGVADIAEVDGTARIVTASGTFGTAVRASGIVTMAYTFGSIPAASAVTLDVAAPGALASGTVASVSFNGADTDLEVSARVSAADVVRVTARNRSTGSIVLGARTYTIAWRSA